MRRPLLADFRYDDHGIRGSAVQPCQPCDDAAAVRGYGGGSVLRYLSGRRGSSELYRGGAGGSYLACGWNRADDWHSAGNAVYDGEWPFRKNKLEGLLMSRATDAGLPDGGEIPRRFLHRKRFCMEGHEKKKNSYQRSKFPEIKKNFIRSISRLTEY